MKTHLLLLAFLALCSASYSQNSAPAAQSQAPGSASNSGSAKVEPNRCFGYRLDDPKGQRCGITCDTGQSARCTSVPLNSPGDPVCNCVKAQGVEGVMPWSSCRAAKKSQEGKDIASCSIACDKRTVATCKDAPSEPASGEPSCRCEPKPAATAAKPANPISK